MAFLTRGTKDKGTIGKDDFIYELNNLAGDSREHKYIRRANIKPYFDQGFLQKPHNKSPNMAYFATINRIDASELFPFWKKRLEHAYVCLVCGNLKITSTNLAKHLEDSHPFFHSNSNSVQTTIDLVRFMCYIIFHLLYIGLY